jgi:hypothetical protein
MFAFYRASSAMFAAYFCLQRCWQHTLAHVQPAIKTTASRQPSHKLKYRSNYGSCSCVHLSVVLQGRQYWQQERCICSHLAGTQPGHKVTLKQADIVAAHEAKSFDYRVGAAGSKPKVSTINQRALTAG